MSFEIGILLGAGVIIAFGVTDGMLGKNGTLLLILLYVGVTEFVWAGASTTLGAPGLLGAIIGLIATWSFRKSIETRIKRDGTPLLKHYYQSRRD